MYIWICKITPINNVSVFKKLFCLFFFFYCFLLFSIFYTSKKLIQITPYNTPRVTESQNGSSRNLSITT